jgi:hypothetical protein
MRESGLDWLQSDPKQESDANDILDRAALDKPADFVLEEEPQGESKSTEVIPSTFESDLESMLSDAEDDIPKGGPGRPKGRKDKHDRAARGYAILAFAKGKCLVDLVKVMVAIDRVSGSPIDPSKWLGTDKGKVLEEFAKTDSFKKYSQHWKLGQPQLVRWLKDMNPFLANLVRPGSEADVEEVENRLLDAKFKPNRNKRVNADRKEWYRALLREARVVLRR